MENLKRNNKHQGRKQWDSFEIKVIEKELAEDTDNDIYNKSTELEGFYSCTHCNLKCGINKCLKII